MKKKICRVCGKKLFDEAILQFINMPKSAQFLPSAIEILTEIGVDVDIFQCSNCALVQLMSEPVPYYREVIRATALSEEMTDFRRGQFKQWIDDYFLQGNKLIEIGCGSGEFLNIMQENEVSVYGLEYGEESVRKAINQGFRVENSFLANDTQLLKEAPFDAFYMLNFLEHLPDPNLTLKGIHNNLVDGAIGLVEVPNFDMIIRNNLFAEFISDHLLYFTQETFISTLSSNGFEVLSCNEVWHDYSLSAVVKKREKTDLSSFIHTQKVLESEVNQYINRFCGGSVAIWGAGHQALAVMSLIELKGKIKYVVDSAKFKQDKFTPATHIPIVSPSMLNDDPVKAIIVMAASYSDEVVKIIQADYRDIDIAVLRESGLEII